MANLTYRVALRDSDGGSGVLGNGEWWLDPVKNIAVSPPVGVFEGTRYIVAATGATGEFLGHEHQIATLVQGVWFFQSPVQGMKSSVLGENGQTYYFNGAEWVPDGGVTAFDGDRPITRNIPNLYGVNVEQTTLRDFIEKVFFVDEPPILSITAAVNTADPSFSNTQREIGNPDGAVSLHWLVQKRQKGITDIVVDASVKPVSQEIDDDLDPSGNKQTGIDQRTIGLDGAGQQTFLLEATDTLARYFTDETNAIAWWHRCYFGAHADTPAAFMARLNGGESPLTLAGMLSAPASSRSRNHNYVCTGGRYIYYLYPLSGGVGVLAGKGYARIPSGLPGYVKNGVGDFSAFDTAEVTVRDRFGIDRRYVLLYTGYQTGDSVNINVTS